MFEIFFSLGDISADRIATYLIPHLRRINPTIKISGIGGKGLQSVADIFLADIVQRSSFGFVEPLRDYFYYRRILKQVVDYWQKNPQVKKVVLMDFYGFNIHLGKAASQLGKEVIYYISPQVWASRPERIKKLKKYVHKMLVLFPFELDIYRRLAVPVDYVGHPLTEIISSVTDPKEENSIGFFPGSRRAVRERHWPLLKETMAILYSDNPNWKFYYFGPPPGPTDFPLKVVSADLADTIRKKIFLALCPSGTVTLENVFYNTAMVVYYRLSPLTYLLARRLVRVNYIAMPNIILEKEVVPEFIQSRATAQNLAGAINNLRQNPSAVLSQLDNFAKIKEYLKTSTSPLIAAAEKINE